MLHLLNTENIKKALEYLQVRGVKVFARVILNKLRGRPASYGIYDAAPIKKAGSIILRSQRGESAGLDIAAIIETFEHKPVFSVIMPLESASLKLLKEAVSSLQEQSYTHWELCPVCDNPDSSKVAMFLTELTAADNRIRPVSCSPGKALEAAQGGFAAIMGSDAKLADDALFWFASEINKHPGADFIYCDECSLDKDKKNERHLYHFKPDWSPSLLLNYMYTGRLAMYRISTLQEAGGLRSGHGDMDIQEYDLALRMGDISRDIRHIERILYYRREAVNLSIPEDNDKRGQYISAVQDWYKRHGMDAAVSVTDGIIDARPVIAHDFLVSIIVPSDNAGNMIQCVKDLQNKTAYKNYEIIMVTNGKAAGELTEAFPGLACLKICRYDNDGPFNFSDKCNKGAAAASGSALCFYNDDAVPVDDQWLGRLLEAAMLPGVGATGPIMLWGNNMIQSAGLITGTQSMCDNAFASGYDYFSKPAGIYSFHLLRDVMLLSGACILINKEAFEKVNGFDAEDFSNAFSDMDICFRLREAGYRCVCSPHSALVHDARNTWRENRKRLRQFPGLLYRWGGQLTRDPYFTDGMKAQYYQPYPFPFARFFVPERPAVRTEHSRDILFVAHNLHLVGAPFVLLYMARAVLENGDWPVLLCSDDGPLKQDFLDSGITVIIDSSFQYSFPVFEYFSRNFDLVVVNTLGCGEAVSLLSGSLPPVLWWIHECPMTLKFYQHRIPAKIEDNIKVYAGSPYSARTLTEAGLAYDYNVLVYGIADKAVPLRGTDGENYAFSAAAQTQPEHLTGMVNSRNGTGKTVFLVVGTVYHRKGQDILLRAIRTLDDDVLSCCEFVFIGSAPDNNPVFRKLMAAGRKNSAIKYFDTMPNDELLSWYRCCDCLISPSREDPMPVVTIDAMMFSKPVICSDQMGTADYITSYEDGIVYPCEDYRALAQHITYAAKNRDRLAQMGRKARVDIYEKHFTMEVFKKNVVDVIDSLTDSAS